MATVITPQNKSEIQKRTVVYSPIYVNGTGPGLMKGCYTLFYIFTDSANKLNLSYSPSTCIIKTLDNYAQRIPHTFVKIGNFASGAKSRHDSNKGDLIKNDGNRSPAARHSQDVLIANPNLFLHFIMVVLTDDPVEKHLEEALQGEVTAIHNKVEKTVAPPGKWNPPVPLVPKADISLKLAEKINPNKDKK